MENILKPENKLTKKILTILSIAVGLYILLWQVEDQVVSRQNYESTAQTEVMKSWGGDVKVGSPQSNSGDGASFNTSFGVRGETKINVNSSERKRGVFRIPVFTATYHQKVTVPFLLSEKQIHIPVYPIEQIQNFRIFDEAGKEISGRIVNNGILIQIPAIDKKKTMTMTTEIVLRGTGRVLYESDLEQEQIHMQGNWQKPKFLDDLLPDQRKVEASGYTADWKLMTLPKDAHLLNKAKVIGVSHLWVNTEYSMVLRSIKYGILFIALTFLFTFLLEVIAKIQIHPFQYGLVGLALTIFYLLLLAFSEVIGFDLSYLLSTFLVVSLIAFYLLGFFKQKKHVLWAVAEQLGLSGFFFVLLRLEERSLLMGSIGLFAALGLLMMITRKVDWSKQEGQS